MSILKYKQLISLSEDFDYGSVIEINISGYNLKSLTKLSLERFINLKKLNCSDNNLKYINGVSKCTSLQTLYCENNKLRNLDGLNSSSLQEILCFNNRLKNIDGLSKCTSLKYLNCSYNNLENIDSLINCTSLRSLNCFKNKLKNINGLSKCTSLKNLNCSYNNLENIDSLINCTSLELIWCNNNQLKTLLPIRNLRNLSFIDYGNNPFEGPHHPSIFRNLKKIVIFYTDAQNVHDSEINKSINDSLNNLMKIYTNHLKSEEEIINKLVELKFSRIEDLLEYFNNKNVHSYFNLTYFEMFQLVFAETERLNFDSEIIKRLEEELEESSCKCFTGRFNRTVNCLNGFSEHINIKISDTSQINAVILSIKNNFEKGKIKREELLDTVRNILEEYNTKEEDIEFYIKIFSEMYLE